MTSRRELWIGTAIAMLAAPGCFFFDSTWGQAKQSQQNVAKHRTPSALKATQEDGADPAREPARHMRPLSMRVVATPRHAAEVIEWKRRIADAFDDANRVLGPTFGVRLDLASTEIWAPPAGDDDLVRLLDDLATADPGQGAHRVLALAGSLPRLEVSFHQLGMAHMPGKHLVVRAMNDAKEYEAIQRSFTELEEQERMKLYRARRRHKEAAVLLHELGHTLGVPHEIDMHTMMSPRYDHKTDSFSAAASKLMKMSLSRELDPDTDSSRVFADGAIGHLRSTAGGWVAAELERVVAILERSRAASPPAVPAPAAPPPPAPSGLTAADRATLERAIQQQNTGQMNEAWNTAQRLFDVYPEAYEVQDLRCQLAIMRGRPQTEIQNECATLRRLSPPDMKKSVEPRRKR